VALTDDHLRDLAARLSRVGGVRGVILGGSRARGAHTPDSDYDLGVYYAGSLDVAALQDLAREVAGPDAQVSRPGDWGRWVDGGGWLRIDGADVDWIYRDLDRVRRAWEDARAGRYSFHTQAGHPLGFPDFCYPAEVALGVVLSDPTGELVDLQEATRDYPSRLGEALVDGLWEADFLVALARKAVTRADATYVAGCLFRVVGLCAHALHGRSGQWLTNEKGAVASAAGLDITPPGFEAQAHTLLARLGGSPEELTASVDAAEQLVAETAAAVTELSGA
jgi:predicted nucleotidyltransferase